MASYARLDIARRPHALAVIAFLFLFSSGNARCQAAVSSTDGPQQIKKLYEAGRWNDVVDAVPQSPNQPADLELYRGLALAQLHRWREAKAALQAGHRGHPHDARFLVELAGIAYIEKRFSIAKTDLRHALAINAGDAYANNLLASIYFLEGNLEAALKYWNRIGKPKLSDLAYDPVPVLEPLILDRAFRFSPGSVWTRDRFLTEQAELKSLDIFPHTYYELEAQPDGSFKLIWHNSERSIRHIAGLENIATMLRGLPYQSVYPEFYDLNRKGLNWLSFVRWDGEKRRLSSEVAAPFFENPGRRYRIYFDGRNENWDISRTLVPAFPSQASMNMERMAAGAEMRFIASGRWQWGIGAEYSYRKFRTLAGIPGATAPFFTDTSGIALRSRVRHSLVRFPERRFTVSLGATAEFGKFYANPLGKYGRLEGSLVADWLPQARGEDYEIRTSLRAGRTFGRVPFDDLFTLGFDRDNRLWMRGHDGLRNGRKGNSPLGRNYVLSNSDFDKIVYKDPFFTVKLGPFLDTGNVYDPSGFFGSPKWLSDTGVQAKIGLLGRFEFVLGYGKDLRSGNDTFYTTVLR